MMKLQEVLLKAIAKKIFCSVQCPARLPRESYPESYCLFLLRLADGIERVHGPQRDEDIPRWQRPPGDEDPPSARATGATTTWVGAIRASALSRSPRTWSSGRAWCRSATCSSRPRRRRRLLGKSFTLWVRAANSDQPCVGGRGRAEGDGRLWRVAARPWPRGTSMSCQFQQPSTGPIRASSLSRVRTAGCRVEIVAWR